MLIQGFFAERKVDLAGLEGFLDGLPPKARALEVRSLTSKEQALLFDASAGRRRVTLDDFVSPVVPPLQQVIHYGRNSLPAFSLFEKRFCRPQGERGRRELWGYNEQTWKTLTGPGYFVARQEKDREVLIDYCEVPPAKPDEWPPILPNSARLSRFIYYRTKDLMRGVSRHVTIGRASRDGKPMDNWFVLCRED